MEALKDRPPTNAKLRAFRATDEFTLEAFRAARRLKTGDGEGLAQEIRRTAAQSGGAVVAATSSPPGGEVERRFLETARHGLVEGRYYLYLARRLGLLDLRRYRGLAARQDAALKEVEALLSPRTPPSGDHPP